MTRYARCGSSQKHRKMPGDATPWKEWSKPVNVTDKKEMDQNKKKLRNKKRKLRYKNKLKALHQNNALKDSPHEEQKTESTMVVSEAEGTTLANDDTTESLEKIIPKISESGKKSRKRNDPETSREKNSPETSRKEKSSRLSKAENSPETSRKKKSSLLSKAENSPETFKERDSHETSSEEKSNDPSEEEDEAKTFDNKMPHPPRDKKASFLGRLKKKRAEKGILLLPPKMEQKIYNIKKALREKNLPPEFIKTVVRKERRKAELKMRKLNKPCLNCRKVGHLYADCPLSSQHGICFKCGSTEHTSSKCSKDISGYPFAKCFICNEQGHISKDCPKNKHGVYIKGGKCHLCGNVNHFKKDCPTLKKQKDEEIIAAYTIDAGVSVDHEIVPTIKKEKQPKPKKAKVVKF